METEEVKEYIRGRREHQKDVASHFKHRYIPSDYAKGFGQWALSSGFYMFIEAVYEKAMQAREKYGFPELGWATPGWELELQRGIAEHLQKGDPRDVAVYAMFAWFHGWPTAPPRDVEEQLQAIIGAIATEYPAMYESGEYYQHEGVRGAIRTLLRDNARLVDETHRWSEAVKKLEAERVAPPTSLVGSERPLVECIEAWREQLLKNVREQSTSLTQGGSDQFLHEGDVSDVINEACNDLINSFASGVSSPGGEVHTSRWAPEAEERTRAGVSTRIGLVPNTQYLSGWERKPAVWKGTYWQHSSFQSKLKLDVRYILVEAEHPPFPPAP